MQTTNTQATVANQQTANAPAANGAGQQQGGTTHTLTPQQVFVAKLLQGKSINKKQLSANAQKRYAARVQKALALRQQKHATRIAAREAAQQLLAKQQAYELAIAQLAAQYGFTPPTVAPAPRANSATTQPSNNQVQVNGVWYKPTHAVHALAALHNGNRKATLAACAQHGINPNTAQTQFAVWKGKQVQ